MLAIKLVLAVGGQVVLHRGQKLCEFLFWKGWVSKDANCLGRSASERVILRTIPKFEGTNAPDLYDDVDIVFKNDTIKQVDQPLCVVRLVDDRKMHSRFQVVDIPGCSQPYPLLELGVIGYRYYEEPRHVNPSNWIPWKLRSWLGHLTFIYIVIEAWRDCNQSCCFRILASEFNELSNLAPSQFPSEKASKPVRLHMKLQNTCGPCSYLHPLHFPVAKQANGVAGVGTTIPTADAAACWTSPSLAMAPIPFGGGHLKIKHLANKYPTN